MKKYGKKNATSHMSSERCNCVDHLYDRQTFQIISCKHKLAHTFHLYTRQNTQAEKEWDFLLSREGQSPSWINPCLRVLVPSPSWIGLDSFLFILFLCLSILNEHNSKFPDSSLSFAWSEDELWIHSYYIENIFSFASCPYLISSLLFFLNW